MGFDLASEDMVKSREGWEGKGREKGCEWRGAQGAMESTSFKSRMRFLPKRPRQLARSRRRVGGVP